MFKIFSLLFLLMLVGCEEPSRPTNDVFEGLSTQERKAALESAIQRATVKERGQIESFFERQQIPFLKTNTGVYYHIYKEGIGELIQADQIVTVEYVVTNLKGDTIYTAQKDSLETFMVEKSNKESGLHEVLKRLRKGTKAVVAIPSHRAHGLTGDDKDIPPLTTVVYNIHIVELK